MKSDRYPQVKIFGVRVDCLTQEQLAIEIEHAVWSRKPKLSFIVFKPYVEFLMRAYDDPNIARLLNQANRVMADGVSVQWAASYYANRTGFFRWLKSWLIDIHRSKWRNQVIPERGAGVDATKKVLAQAQEHGWRIGILGGPADTQQTKRALEERFPKLRGIIVESGYYALQDEAEVVERLKKAKLDILFVAIGFPRQEKFIIQYREQGLAPVMLGEGGTFDYDQMGGPKKRAPLIMRRLSLEWLWRLLLEPRRLRRQLAIPRFMWTVYRLSNKKLSR
ncbi:WecB/TagA/CpsF family glycosyltransferase [Candidatus Saccharibacteria bacterium]|nr:WecB/TagA/CpsF family glycosyltransferase [Candidatus Saccharibacteria bacterium]